MEERSRLMAELAAMQEKYVGDLANRDREYKQELAVFRNAVQDIASTPEGATALAEFNRGNWIGAKTILDGLAARGRSRILSDG